MITLEEHAFIGGLGSKINNWLFKNDNGNKIKTINFHTPDDFIHLLGKQDFLRNQLGLDYNSIAKKLKNL